jgi:hypothetical protein
MYKLKAFLCFILSVCCVITFIPDVFADKPSSPMSKSNSFRGALDYIDSGSYYALPNSTAQPLETVVEADMKKCNIKSTTQLGQSGVMVEENVSADFDINVPREGYYNINLGYITTIGNNFETVISLKTNGQLPFAGNNRFSVQKTYIDEGKITADSNGNQLRSRSIQVRKQQNFNWWQATKIGAGPEPIETAEGWLMFYHGVTNTCSGLVYSFGAAILDINEPSKVLYRTRQYWLTPEMPYETIGYVPNVCFPCANLYDAKTGLPSVCLME